MTQDSESSGLAGGSRPEWLGVPGRDRDVRGSPNNRHQSSWSSLQSLSPSKTFIQSERDRTGSRTILVFAVEVPW